MIMLRELRAAAGLTQAQAAAALGVAQPTYALWETGRKDRKDPTPPLSKIRPMAELYHVPIDVILDALTIDREEVG